MATPLFYTLEGLIQRIKLYAYYEGVYPWCFENPCKEAEKFCCDETGPRLEVSFDNYRAITPAILCSYGELIIEISARVYRKYSKTVPELEFFFGKFSLEQEVSQGLLVKDESQYSNREIAGFKARACSH